MYTSWIIPHPTSSSALRVRGSPSALRARGTVERYIYSPICLVWSACLSSPYTLWLSFSYGAPMVTSRWFRFSEGNQFFSLLIRVRDEGVCCESPARFEVTASAWWAYNSESIFHGYIFHNLIPTDDCDFCIILCAIPNVFIVVVNRIASVCLMFGMLDIFLHSQLALTEQLITI